MTDSAFWDKIAPKYAAQPIKDIAAYEKTLARTRSYLHANDHVLELGCGTGSTALRLASMVRRYTATDISSQMISIGQSKALLERVGNVDFHAAGWSDPRLLDDDYNVVLALNLLHLLDDLPTVLRRIQTLMPTGGYFISKTPVAPQSGAPLGYWAIRAVLPLLRFFGRVPFVAFRRAADFDAVIEAAGFEIVETLEAPASPPSRYVVARKK